jgi:hypothetical protein
MGKLLKMKEAASMFSTNVYNCFTTKVDSQGLVCTRHSYDGVEEGLGFVASMQTYPLWMKVL